MDANTTTKSPTQKQQQQLYQYQISNMYDRQKHYNQHDIIGIKGLTKAQTRLLDQKKVQYRVNNQTYLRAHPQLQNMISVFLFKVLEEKPKDILKYAGKYFDQPELDRIINIESKHYDAKRQSESK